MKTKKYLSIIVIFFLLINIIFVNGETTLVQDSEKSQTETSTENQVSENSQTENIVSEKESPQDITSTEKSEKENNLEEIIEEIVQENTSQENSKNLQEENIENEDVDSEKIIIAQEDSEENETIQSNQENQNYSKEIQNQTIVNNTIVHKTNSTYNENLTTNTEENNKGDSSSSSYIEIEKLNSDSPSKENNKTSHKEENKTIKITLQTEGKVSVKGEIPANFSSEITKEEKITNKEHFSKQVTIKSSEHLNSPLTVYSEIPETKKENIIIYWKNEDKEIEVSEYIDEDNNGLIERIGWIVPHLSEQIFEIKISSEEKDNSSDEILINVNLDASENPIKFDIGINYTNINDLDCSIKIFNNSYESLKNFSPTTNQTFEFNLQDALYNYNISCVDTNDISKINSVSGDFIISQDFSVKENNQEWSESEEKFYFLDLVHNELKNSPEISISSNSSSIPKIEIFKGTDLINTFNSSNFELNENIINSSGIYTMNISFDSPSAKTTLTRKFSVASADIQISDESIKVGENTDITVIINSSKIGILHY